MYCLTLCTYCPSPQKSLCPCWSQPGNGSVCPNITIPVYLSTVNVGNGTSYKQCIDPASECYCRTAIAAYFRV